MLYFILLFFCRLIFILFYFCRYIVIINIFVVMWVRFVFLYDIVIEEILNMYIFILMDFVIESFKYCKIYIFISNVL